MDGCLLHNKHHELDYCTSILPRPSVLGTILHTPQPECLSERQRPARHQSQLSTWVYGNALCLKQKGVLTTPLRRFTGCRPSICTAICASHLRQAR